MKRTYIYKVDKIFVWAVHQSEQIFVSGHSYFTSWVGCYNRIVVLVEEYLPPARPGEDWPWRDTLDLHHDCHMVLFVFAGKEWVTDVKFIKDTAKAPHVYRCLIGNSKHNLWSSIKPWLDISINLFVLKAPRSKVNDLYTWLIDLSQKNILWFQVTVHNIIFV